MDVCAKIIKFLDFLCPGQNGLKIVLPKYELDGQEVFYEKICKTRNNTRNDTL